MYSSSNIDSILIFASILSICPSIDVSCKMNVLYLWWRDLSTNLVLEWWWSCFHCICITRCLKHKQHEITWNDSKITQNDPKTIQHFYSSFVFVKFSVCIWLSPREPQFTVNVMKKVIFIVHGRNIGRSWQNIACNLINLCALFVCKKFGNFCWHLFFHILKYENFRAY